jgi:thiol-disulfide isomerase/thioredoxin
LASEATQPGHHFVDIEGTDYASGKSSSLSKMIDGKVAVVDFWASWCRPCREEITNYLIPIYNEFKDKGVVVVGVDVSDRPEDHDKAVKELKIEYQQLLDSKKTAGELYGLASIPQIILIDKDGNIVERDLRGDDIKIALEKLLGE